MKIFGNYARYYNLLYRDKDYTGEAAYIHRLIKTYASGARTLLDLGCGTGKHALALSKKGYFVTGVDISEEMVSLAKAQIKSLKQTKIKLVTGDIRNIRLKKKFDVITSLFHVMSYQANNADIEAALNTARIHLKNKGVFIFDCWYGPAVLTNLPGKKVKRLEDEAISVTRISVPKIYPNENIVDVNYTVFIKDKKDKTKVVTEELRERHRMRYLFKPEIEYFLSQAGFALIYSREWLSGKKLGFDTWGGCFIGKKI